MTRHIVFACVLAAIVLASLARERGWVLMPDIAMQALLLLLPVTLIPLYLQGLREGELVMPPHVIRRRDTPRLFWFVAIFDAVMIVALLIYLGAELLRSLAA